VDRWDLHQDLVSYSIFSFNFAISNVLVFLALVCLIPFYLFESITNLRNNTLYIISSNTQIFFELLFDGVKSIVSENIQASIKQKFFPLIFSLFIFVLLSNLLGMIPYSFTLTSHLSFTFTLSFIVFLGIQIISIKEHGLGFFGSFFPSGTSIVLGFLLVPIEIISFIFKPISLSIRLFANMMAGHTLLKVIAGFAWSLMGSCGVVSTAYIIPVIILVLLFVLETGVAIIQAFVFCVLICIYLNDALVLH